MAFTQAQIKVGNEAAFAEFKSVLEGAFSAANVEGFLKSVGKKGLRVRQFEQVRDAGLLDRFRGGKSVSELWSALAVGDRQQGFGILSVVGIGRVTDAHAQADGSCHLG